MAATTKMSFRTCACVCCSFLEEFWFDISFVGAGGWRVSKTANQNTRKEQVHKLCNTIEWVQLLGRVPFGSKVKMPEKGQSNVTGSDCEAPIGPGESAEWRLQVFQVGRAANAMVWDVSGEEKWSVADCTRSNVALSLTQSVHYAQALEHRPHWLGDNN